jgi:Protein of unknown function (DUF1254)
MTNVAKPEAGRAPVNQFDHHRDFPDAKNNKIVGMNMDTLYSLAQLDLSAEPIVLVVPPMDAKRWWIMQIIDGWNDVPAAPGSRTHGDKRRGVRARRPGLQARDFGRARRDSRRYEHRGTRRSDLHGWKGRSAGGPQDPGCLPAHSRSVRKLRRCCYWGTSSAAGHETSTPNGVTIPILGQA